MRGARRSRGWPSCLLIPASCSSPPTTPACGEKARVLQFFFPQAALVSFLHAVHVACTRGMRMLLLQHSLLLPEAEFSKVCVHQSGVAKGAYLTCH